MSRRAGLGLVVALVLVLFVLAAPAGVAAASPTPSAGQAGDTRSAGQGPGLVGAPGLAILGVLGLGIGTAVLTILYVRMSTPRPTRPDGER